VGVRCQSAPGVGKGLKTSPLILYGNSLADASVGPTVTEVNMISHSFGWGIVRLRSHSGSKGNLKVKTLPVQVQI
jgi:hypothetical protein